MPRRKYSDEELKDLIAYYKSELKKLQFQVAETRETIAKLQAKASPEKEEEEQADEQDKPAPKKATVKKKAPRKRGRKKKRAPYKLSDWDQFILDAIEKEDRLLTKAELELMVARRAESLKEEMTPEQVSNKVTRILHKLGSKRGQLQKYSLSGRGYGYGLNKWFFQTTGKLKRKYIP